LLWTSLRKGKLGEEAMLIDVFLLCSSFLPLPHAPPRLLASPARPCASGLLCDLPSEAGAGAEIGYIMRFSCLVNVASKE
jgi:hypothetical protein